MFCPTDLFSIEANEGAAASICFIRTDLGSITECGGVDTGGVSAQGGLKTVIWTYPGSRVLGVETGFVTLLIDPVFFGSCTNSLFAW